jgi:RNA polymerase sigma factor (sigma-70 family)
MTHVECIEVAMENHCEPPLSHARAWEGGWPQTADAFERLVEAYQNRLVRHAFARLDNLHDAEDVAQEVFVRAFAQRARHKKVAHVGAYLYRMTSNLCTDFLRRRRGGTVDLDDAAIEEIPWDRPNPAEMAAAVEEARRVEAWLASLPANQAEIVRLKALEGLTLSEIAVATDSRLATVKSRLRYALAKLRTIVARDSEAIQ